jgi:predicted MFS family arabinose efflux permease
MGVGIDLHGVRRTVLTAFPLAIAGALLSALSTHFALLITGQVLIGVGCAPAFLVCTVFIARHFPAARFASVSGLVLGIGGLGMLLTGTPLAWLVEARSWRMGFAVLAAASALAWLSILLWVREPAREAARPKESLLAALRQFGVLFAMPHTLGILLLGAVTYAAFISLRGLWLGPLLIERYGYSLVQSGNVALIVSVVSLFGPPLFGRLDRDGPARRRRIVACCAVYAALFATIGVFHAAWIDIGCAILIGLLSGFIVWEYADVRVAYPAALTGRAMAVFTMAMFLGVALMQWLTGWRPSRHCWWPAAPPSPGCPRRPARWRPDLDFEGALCLRPHQVHVLAVLADVAGDELAGGDDRHAPRPGVVEHMARDGRAHAPALEGGQHFGVGEHHRVREQVVFAVARELALDGRLVAMLFGMVGDGDRHDVRAM